MKLVTSLHYTPISPRIILVPIVPDLYIWLVDLPHTWESNRGLADNHGQSPGNVGDGLAQSPQSYES